ncbi:MAG: HD domain-containing protein, partial [Flavobacteriaceae bacterium]
MKSIVLKSEERVTDLLTNELRPEFLYHNLRHTQRVVSATEEILETVELSKEQNEQLRVAAWFHDVGYIKGTEGHEENSCLVVQDFLKEEGKTQDYIREVCQLIRATKRGYEPENLSEEI